MENGGVFRLEVLSVCLYFEAATEEIEPAKLAVDRDQPYLVTSEPKPEQERDEITAIPDYLNIADAQKEPFADYLEWTL